MITAKTIRRAAAALAAFAAVGLCCAPAQAQTASTTKTVTLTIQAGCTVSATPLSFGTSQVLAANIDASSTITPVCTNTTPYSIGIDAGGGAGATTSDRLMTGPASATVLYRLYRDSARTQIWGSTIGTNTVSAVGNGLPQPVTVFGRVPPQASPAPGSYQDIVTVTVTF